MLNEKKIKNTINILNSQYTINCVPIVYFIVLVKGENKFIKLNNDTIFFRSDEHLILFFFSNFQQPDDISNRILYICLVIFPNFLQESLSKYM